MVKDLVPPYLSAIVPCNFENIHDYNTRQAVSIPPVRTRTTLYNNYFLPSTVRLWNSEPTSIRDSKSPLSLKSYYRSKCIKKPIYYYSGTRIGQILHMRLRTACSSLCQVHRNINWFDIPISRIVEPMTIKKIMRVSFRDPLMTTTVGRIYYIF
jgi:hypothetical protein